jgi:hypothetical protein
MSHEPWINHDKYHRLSLLIPRPELEPKPEPVKKEPLPYPSRERIAELFYLEDGLLRYRNVHGNARKDGIAGYINKKSGIRYVRIDHQQCNADRLIRIYLGEEKGVADVLADV